MDRDSTGILFRAAVDGDTAAWKSLVEGLSPLVWSIVRAHGLRDADAQEVYQTTWFRLAQNLARIREPDRVGAWLASTARHECVKVIRTARRISPSDDPEVFDRTVESHTPEQAVIDAEEASMERERMRATWQSFQELGENCRRLLRLLMASPPVSYQEVSATLGIAVGSIGPIRQRCLRRLRVLLAERGFR
ncbi:sigma-70 family RNA polymerase sigma factor [Streptosporangium sp. NBC_01755]|uniref:RNA polymerase sigma factor n=1 Tax=unclassified Streptosporangium TaxID=2632669 RepID=UPI002DDA43DC|nr:MULTISPECIES: sigma-70 family RNA polymerase sigma factor [unclassified Streptosporangium]WSA25955.1 sigma-70 family RNA polymerase sigma factor [Streptosporangium sp. NBC_01810]WSD02656.1 sigma-70 family RNA polymerase sigma factor [Streptosporangium sp. NBC_01755]